MSRKKTIWLWAFSIIFTIGVAYLQRITGPSYPLKSKVSINNIVIKSKLPRSSDAENGELIKIIVHDKSVTGEFKYKRFKSYDTLTTVPMTRDGDTLTAIIPKQPPAGKVMYMITLISGNSKVALTDDYVILRYTGNVPEYILFLHIIIIFLAMLYSTRAGVEAMYKGIKTYRYAFIAMVTLFIGGLILGPVVQKYAFNAYWTGWPFGQDLTDNKTLVAFIFWAIAFFRLSRNKNNFKWAIIAAIVLLIIFLIPHSMLGSEIDYTVK
ncbi:MAG: hypothetical protein V1904_06345 [Bacteroidota bacterium]